MAKAISPGKIFSKRTSDSGRLLTSAWRRVNKYRERETLCSSEKVITSGESAWVYAEKRKTMMQNNFTHSLLRKCQRNVLLFPSSLGNYRRKFFWPWPG